jgi:hypothetical protein
MSLGFKYFFEIVQKYERGDSSYLQSLSKRLSFFIERATLPPTVESKDACVFEMFQQA